MKKIWIPWWVANIFWMMLFAAGTLFVFMRKVDGAGVVQTFETKLVSFIVLAIAFIFPLIIQIIWMIINLIFTISKQT